MTWHPTSIGRMLRYHPYERITGRRLTDAEVEDMWGLPDHQVLRLYVFVPPRWEPRLDANGRWHESAPIKLAR